MLSLPVRGAWIEIDNVDVGEWVFTSLPVRGAWIEIWQAIRKRLQANPSLPVRGAWIEILIFIALLTVEVVAPRAGSVD